MKKGMGELKKIVEEVIGEVLEYYEKDRDGKSYTTEGNIVSHIFARLLGAPIWDKGIKIHSQVRPFKGEIGKEKVIRDGKWKDQQGKANAGSVVDLAILDMRDRYWKKALEKAIKDQFGEDRSEGSLRHWRILSYPVEAFRAAIEVKIRVRGNKRKILKDVEKLCAIKRENPECLAYMVIADRCAPTDIISDIKEYAERNGIKILCNSCLRYIALF
ncbi:MAG: hypothetical protein DRN03_05405 [Thermoplasmata archaeon]|nr:MAG: hypothetical protein DRN03_05405 [Thermoplasmata archaeon]